MTKPHGSTLPKTVARDDLTSSLWRACDIMRRDDNCGGVLEYIEHLTWLLFLKFLDDQEAFLEQEAATANISYRRKFQRRYSWSGWVPKAFRTWNDDEFMTFVRRELLKYWSSISGAPYADVISSVFRDRSVVLCASPDNLRDVIRVINEISFASKDDILTVSHVYEELLYRVGAENRLAGEFYTPRALARFLCEVVTPSVGETVYDPACGTCGLLVEAYRWTYGDSAMAGRPRSLPKGTFIGREKKPVPAMLGQMNMILHGALTPVVERRNTLEDHKETVNEAFDIIISNPPFGGVEGRSIQDRFPVRSGSTEILFLQHIMQRLAPNGRCGMVVPEGLLFKAGAFTKVKQSLLETCRVTMIVNLPPGAFAPYSDVETALLFFDRSGSTNEVLFYEVPPPANGKFSRSQPIAEKDFVEVKAIQHQWHLYLNKRGPRPLLTKECRVEHADDLIAKASNLSARSSYEVRQKEQDPTALVCQLMEKTRILQSTLERLQQTLRVTNEAPE